MLRDAKGKSFKNVEKYLLEITPDKWADVIDGARFNTEVLTKAEDRAKRHELIVADFKALMNAAVHCFWDEFTDEDEFRDLVKEAERQLAMFERDMVGEDKSH